ncbi:MAG: glycosyltransferase [Planctomycetota bacterium]
MKVIHLFRTSASGYGLERNILCTLPGLLERGIETVAVAVMEERADSPPPDFVRQLEGAGVRCIGIESKGRLPFALARCFSKIFRAEAPDIIHSHGYKCDLAMLLADTGGAVRMTTVHGWLSRGLRERFYEWLNVQCCKRFDRVIVFCEDYRRRLVSRGVREHLVRVIPVGLDTAVVPREGTDCRKRWAVPEGGVLVAQLGRLSQEKHPETFVEIAVRLSDEFPDARFVLVGDGAMRATLEQTIASAGKSDAIMLAGYVVGMADVIDALDIVVSCSTTEGVPRTLLEAGAGAVPVVATDVGGVPDAVDDGVTGIICPPGDVRAIADGIRRLIKDAGLRARMGIAAKGRIATVFSVDTCSQRLIDDYEILLSDPRAGA